MDSMIVRELGKRRLERIPVRVAAPDRTPGDRYDWRTQNAPRRRGCGCDAQRDGAYHRRDNRRMQLYVTIRTKTAARPWMNGYEIAALLNISSTFLQMRDSNTEMPTSSR